ncbi:MAG: hypothetical protein GY699_19470 [Desulfobacteraceae bacterium]|nr:hypothetical protein [Desulfobacteraceae bacterium]
MNQVENESNSKKAFTDENVFLKTENEDKYEILIRGADKCLYESKRQAEIKLRKTEENNANKK